jgi:phosphoglycolate phosphatase
MSHMSETPKTTGPGANRSTEALSGKTLKAPLESTRITGKKKKGASDKIYFEAVLFDLDGTLVDSASDIAAATNHVREQMGLPVFGVDKIKGFVGDGVRVLLSRALDTQDDAVINQALAIWEPHYREHCLDHTCLFPGIEQTLQELHADHVPLALVSNKMVSFCEQILEGLKIRQFFSSVIGGDSTPERKPHPGPMLLAAENLKVNSKIVLVVGDNPNDIIAGQKAGFKSCGVLWGIGLEKVIRDAGPDYVIHMPSDISRIIRTIVSI